MNPDGGALQSIMMKAIKPPQQQQMDDKRSGAINDARFNNPWAPVNEFTPSPHPGTFFYLYFYIFYLFRFYLFLFLFLFFIIGYNCTKVCCSEIMEVKRHARYIVRGTTGNRLCVTQ